MGFVHFAKFVVPPEMGGIIVLKVICRFLIPNKCIGRERNLLIEQSEIANGFAFQSKFAQLVTNQVDISQNTVPKVGSSIF